MEHSRSSRCRVCGQSSPVSASFCPRCGARLLPPPGPKPDKPGGGDG